MCLSCTRLKKRVLLNLCCLVTLKERNKMKTYCEGGGRKAPNNFEKIKEQKFLLAGRLMRCVPSLGRVKMQKKK